MWGFICFMVISLDWNKDRKHVKQFVLSVFITERYWYEVKGIEFFICVQFLIDGLSSWFKVWTHDKICTCIHVDQLLVGYTNYREISFSWLWDLFIYLITYMALDCHCSSFIPVQAVLFSVINNNIFPALIACLPF